MSEVLKRAIDAVELERGGKFDEAFKAARDLVEHYGEKCLAERVVSEAPTSTPWEILADLLAILVWTTNDNGEDIIRTAEQWLRSGNDIRRVRIALNLDVYPFKQFEEMKNTLEMLADAWPEESEIFYTLIQQRQKEDV